MCGICGEWRFDGATPKSTTLSAMTTALKRRGPDAEGVWSDRQIAFGHRRLSIIDLSDAAAQPMRDPHRGNILVFNGVIYNYRSLRQTLIARGEQFNSTGDTEVILKAYAVWGPRCVEHFDGIFAFALWDSANQSLLLARDRVGVKPLYYSLTTKRLRFASSLPALLAADDLEPTAERLDRSLNLTALHAQFTLHGVVPAPNTLVTGIQKCPPATTLLWRGQPEAESYRYWQPSLAVHAQRSPDDEVQAVTDALVAAVERQVTAADVPVGLLLSGGLDSSLLLALMLAAGKGQASSVHTFSLGFESHAEEEGDEFYYSDLVAHHFATPHQRIHISDHEAVAEMPAVIAAMSEPMFSQDNIGFYLLSQRVAQSHKVVLSGQGADEVFAGYYWYRSILDDVNLSGIERLRRHYLDRERSEWLEMLKPHYYNAMFADGDPSERWLESQFQGAGRADGFLAALLRCDATTLITDDPLKRVDNMSMAWGLEARVPFLDHRLIETALSIPVAHKLANGGKYHLKQLARRYLPAEVIDRRKGYFPTPVVKYLRGGLLERIRDLLHSQVCRERGLFIPGYLDGLLQDPLRQFTPLQGNKLWHAASFEWWLQTHRVG